MEYPLNPDSIPGVEVSIRDDKKPRMGYGGQIWVHVEGKTNGGCFGMWEGFIPPGGVTPLHIHGNEDEAIYILEGRFRIVCGDQIWETDSGNWFKMPKGVPHGFQIVSETPGRFLEFFLPAGLEELFVKLPPQQTGTKPDMAKILKVAESYGLTFLGPLPWQTK